MSERLEWELVPQVREEDKEMVHLLAEEALELDAMMEMAPHTMSQAQRGRLVELQRLLEDCVASPCEATAAALVKDRQDWKAAARESYARFAPSDVTEEQFLEYTGTQYDCVSCPGASKYAGVSGIPCDFDLTHMLRILSHDEVSEQVQFELRPSEMLTMADALDQVLALTSFTGDPEVEEPAYLKAAAEFLRFWAGLGFGVAPAFVEYGV